MPAGRDTGVVIAGTERLPDEEGCQGIGIPDGIRMGGAGRPAPDGSGNPPGVGEASGTGCGVRSAWGPRLARPPITHRTRGRTRESIDHVDPSAGAGRIPTTLSLQASSLEPGQPPPLGAALARAARIAALQSLGRRVTSSAAVFFC